MDIDLLSKMVRELILDNDRVALPGLGFFAAEIVPSTFSDRGYTINPPYRKLYFRQDSGRDGLLARLYAESNGTGTDVAEHIIEDFIRGMREVLDKEKVIVFPGLGRLRATRENNYFFVPDEDMDIFPEGAGLEPVSLKTHKVQTDEPVETDTAQQEECRIEEEASSGEVPDGERTKEHVPVHGHAGDSSDETEPVAEELISEQDALPEQPDRTIPQHEESGPEKEDAGGTVRETAKKGMPGWLKVFAAIVAAILLLAAVSLGVFVLLADICPDFVDSVLYSPEELEILNY